MFDKNWHKIHVSVFQDGVILYVDCKELAYGQLTPRGVIQTDGNITIAKFLSDKTTAPVFKSPYLIIDLLFCK